MSSQVDACCLETDFRWWICILLLPWLCNALHWWHMASLLFLYFFFLSWLSQKVCYYTLLLFLLVLKPIFSLRVLLAGVRNNGDCPCPCCLVKKWDIGKIGQALNLWNHISNAHLYVGEKIKDAHDFIFKLGYNIGSATVECLLSEHSWVPTLVDV